VIAYVVEPVGYDWRLAVVACFAIVAVAVVLIFFAYFGSARRRDGKDDSDA
jgi:ABC-type uncharacterized transport system permease subunit